MFKLINFWYLKNIFFYFPDYKIVEIYNLRWGRSYPIIPPLWTLLQRRASQPQPVCRFPPPLSAVVPRMVSQRQRLARKVYKEAHPELFPKAEPAAPKDPTKKKKKKSKLKPKRAEMKGPKSTEKSDKSKLRKHPLRVPGMKPGESCFICKAKDHIAKHCPEKAQWERHKVWFFFAILFVFEFFFSYGHSFNRRKHVSIAESRSLGFCLLNVAIAKQCEHVISVSGFGLVVFEWMRRDL